MAGDPACGADAQLPRRDGRATAFADGGVLPQCDVEVGNELFWYIFDGEPVAKDGMVNLSDDLPGFGLTLQTPDENFRLTV